MLSALKKFVIVFLTVLSTRFPLSTICTVSVWQLVKTDPQYIACLSVCPTVTFRYRDHTGWNTLKIIYYIIIIIIIIIIM